MKKAIPIVVIMSFLLSAIPINISGQAINEGAQEAGDLISIPSASNDEYAPGELIVKFSDGVNIEQEDLIFLEGTSFTNEATLVTKEDEGLICSEDELGEIGAITQPLEQEDILFTGIASLDVLNSQYGVYSARKLRTYDVTPASSNIYVLELPADSDIQSIAEEYSNDPNVDYAEPNYYYSLFTTVTKTAVSTIIPFEVINDPASGLQWWLNNNGFTGGTPDADIDAPEAWYIEKGDPEITVAILDTGVDYTHIDLAANMWVNPGEIPDNGIDDDGNDYIDDIHGWNFLENNNDPLDIYGHGTHCSGIVAAVTNNNEGVAGVTWNCKIMAVTLNFDENLLTSDETVEAVFYATLNGADVISMSWGGSHHSEALYNALKYAFEHDVVLVASAGNFNSDAEMLPAAYPFIISVGATDYNDERAVFSSYGKTLDVAAPGVSVYSTMPSYHTVLNDVGYDMMYSSMSGTSMSAPCVAGVAALLLSKNKNYLNPVGMVRTMILNTVDPIDPDEYIGRGRVNAYNAVSKEPAIAIMDPYPDWLNVKGTLHISGWAYGSTFQEYTVSYREYNQFDYWHTIKTSTDPIINNNDLATFNTKEVDNGVYEVKLTVTCSDGTYTDETIIPVENKKSVEVGIVEVLGLEETTILENIVESTEQTLVSQQSLPLGR